MGDPAMLSDLEDVFSNIVSVVMGLSAITLFIFLIMGGFKLITSSGDPGKAQAAWKTITFAIIGIIVIAASILVLRLIYAFTGVDVTIFKVTS